VDNLRSFVILSFTDGKEVMLRTKKLLPVCRRRLLG
jgi:hypothetical protein